jgi:hypothetical protein
MTFHFIFALPILYRIINGKSSPGSKKKCLLSPVSDVQPASEKIQRLICCLKILLTNLSNYEKTDLPKGTKAQELYLCAFEEKKLNQRRK